MDNSKLMLYGGLALGGIALYIAMTKRDAIVQTPQIGQVGTSPGRDTTGEELAFKAKTFDTYANLLGLRAGLDSRERQLDRSLTSSERLEGMRQTGQTERTQILADSDALSDALRYETQRQQIRAQTTGNILRSIMQALGSLRPQPASGSGSGSGSVGTPPTFPGRPMGNRPIQLPYVNVPGFDSIPLPNMPSPIDFNDTWVDFGIPVPSQWWGNPISTGNGSFGGGLGESEYPIFGDNPYPEYGDWGWNFDPTTGDYIGG